ncbi:hypothetical protein [Bradyrhizobium sp. WSM1417]|uniref:hypothetical protein n=1 Tax=Bradyrhizobium sp. WSM1417 TaxID=754500 RepID=UPI0018DD8F98|nr:hypothetical protein [Bradyrhizobium sp. WSM1417]
MGFSDKNSIPDLVELIVRCTPSAAVEGQNEIRSELRVQPAMLEASSKLRFSVGLKRLMLSLDLSGLHAVPGSRHGEPIKESQETRERTVSTEISVERKRTGGLGLKLALNSELSAKTDDSQAIAEKGTVSTTEKQTHYRVRARGNLTWEISEPPWEMPILDGTYLNDALLLRTSCQDRANTKRIDLTAYAKQKDIVFTPEKVGVFRGTNERKLLQVLLSKALAGSDSFAGLVAFSRSEIDVED